jgi:hypothetical protein
MNGHVLPNRELVIAETVQGLVLALAFFVVMHEPACPAMGKETIRVALLVRTEADDRANLPFFPPFFGVKAAVGVQRRRNNVALARIAVRKAGVPRKRQYNLCQRHRGLPL